MSKPHQALRLAAPAPSRTRHDGDAGDDDDDADIAQTEQDCNLHALCEDWFRWCRTRRLYGPAADLPSLLGRLTARQRGPVRPGGPDAACSAELAAFHLAYLCQPDELDKRIFELHYWHRVKPVKLAAQALGVSRKTWYARLAEFRVRVHALAQDLCSENARQRIVLQQRREALRALGCGAPAASAAAAAQSAAQSPAQPGP